MRPEQNQTVTERDYTDQSHSDQHPTGQDTGHHERGSDPVEHRAGHTDGRAQAHTGDGDSHERLVPADHAASYGSRWDTVKGTFVDEPRQAVAQADELVGEVLDELETLFREQRARIERGLDSDETSTEDLRIALGRYRSFFDRLLAI